MTPTIFGGLVIALGVWCQFGAWPRTVKVMLLLVIFGAASALDLPALGGASVTPANFFLVFYLLRIASMRGGIASVVAEVAPTRPLFPFLLLVVWICGSAILLPRLFDGGTQVFSLSRALADDGGTTPLHPTSGNISQAVYALGGFAAACITAAFGRRPGAARAFVSALMILTATDIGFAVLDLVTAATHTGFILDLVHTASYAFLTDDELGGLKRISGSFSEASTFATFSVTLLAVNLSLFLARVKTRFTGVASLLLLGFVVLSTSSAGYVGLGALFVAVALYAAVQASLFGRKRALASVGMCTAAGLLLASLVILFVPSIQTTAQHVLSDSLFNKAQSDSAIERGSWNAQALMVFRDTHWLGGGIGATRGSNYALVLLSNLGIIGFVLFVVVILKVSFGRLAPDLNASHRKLVWAARCGLLITLVPSLLIGTVYDLGTLFYILIGIASSGSPMVGETVRDARKSQTNVRMRQPSHRPSATLQ